MQKFNLKLKEIGFTDKEINILLFLSIFIFLGAILKILKENNQDVKYFDYTTLDKKFEAYSLKIDSISNEESTKENSIHNIKESDSSNFNTLSALASGASKKSVVLNDKIIDLNSATKENLMLLPGVGLKMAENIISYRKEHGKFRSIEEIMDVKGIGNKKFEKMKNNISVK